MPNGQNRYADKARKRSPRSGRTIRVGKNIGSAPVDGRYADVVRELTRLLPLLTYGDWKRLGKWVVALAKEQGITPATDDNQATPSDQLTQSIGKWFNDLGLLPDGSKNWEPNEFSYKQLTPAEQRKRKARSYHRRKEHIDFLRELVGKQAEPKPNLIHSELFWVYKKEIEEWDSPENQQHWEKFWDHYGQCEQSIHGQELAAMSPAERSEHFRKLAEADIEVSRDLAAD